MLVKTFEALSIKDAVKAIKREFGNDAIILSTKERPIPGQAGTAVEVVAAVPDRTRLGGATRDVSGEFAEAQNGRLEALEVKLTRSLEILATKQQCRDIEVGLAELKLLLGESLRERDGAYLKGLPANLAEIDRQLRVMGVDAIHVSQLIKHLSSLPTPVDAAGGPEDPDEYYRSRAIRWMIRRISVAAKWDDKPGVGNIQIFIGPSGSGKTALIAKLAAHYHRREKSRVLVISFDGTRIAGSEQLRLYAKIIGVPFTTVSEPAELASRIAQHRGMDLVLVDTAGNSLRNESYVSELKKFRQANVTANFHAVLSATERQSHLEQAIRHFSPLGIGALSFSRVEESWDFGQVFNIAAKWSLPLSFFGVGVNVPEDMEVATRERVIERIFGL